MAKMIVIFSTAKEVASPAQTIGPMTLDFGTIAESSTEHEYYYIGRNQFYVITKQRTRTDFMAGGR